MPVDTRTMPGTIRTAQGGEAIASGWCLIAYEMVGHQLPLEEWRGEIACTNDDERNAVVGAGGVLYLELAPYGGVFEAWHGPVTVEAVGAEDDPNQRRLRLRPAGALNRAPGSLPSPAPEVSEEAR